MLACTFLTKHLCQQLVPQSHDGVHTESQPTQFSPAPTSITIIYWRVFFSLCMKIKASTPEIEAGSTLKLTSIYIRPNQFQQHIEAIPISVQL